MAFSISWSWFETNPQGEALPDGYDLLEIQGRVNTAEDLNKLIKVLNIYVPLLPQKAAHPPSRIGVETGEG